MPFNEQTKKYGPTKQFERLDRICDERYGSSEKDVVVFVLTNNPGLEYEGIILRPGMTILLPDLPNSIKASTSVKQIMLWD
jgi:phage tail protein X